MKPIFPAFLLAFALIAAGPAILMAESTPAAKGPGPTRPNILLVVVDDLRFDDFGAAGHPFARTPNLDRLAREGGQFKNFFAVTPLCSPSRANILTGLYTRHHGILDNTERSARSHELQTFARSLHDAGYHTGFPGRVRLNGQPQGQRLGVCY